MGPNDRARIETINKVASEEAFTIFMRSDKLVYLHYRDIDQKQSLINNLEKIIIGENLIKSLNSDSGNVKSNLNKSEVISEITTMNISDIAKKEFICLIFNLLKTCYFSQKL